MFGKFASGIQSLITSIGIIIAGIWVLYTFRELGVSQRSRAEIAEIEKRSVEQPAVMYQVRSNVIEDNSGNKYSISTEVSVKNVGKSALEISDIVLYVSKLADNEEELILYGRILRLTLRIIDSGSATDMTQRIFRSGESRTIAFMITVPSSGNYFLQFEALYSGLVLKDTKIAPTSDVPIRSVEQSIVHIPHRLSNAPTTEARP